MHSWIRRIHLFTGLFLLVFVLLYSVSGYLMIHEDWFHRGDPKKTTRTERLTYAGDRSTSDFVSYLEDTYGVRGKRQPPRRRQDGSWQFNYVRPGVNHEMVVSPAGDQVTLTRSEFGAVGLGLLIVSFP